MKKKKKKKMKKKNLLLKPRLAKNFLPYISIPTSFIYTVHPSVEVFSGTGTSLFFFVVIKVPLIACRTIIHQHMVFLHIPEIFHHNNFYLQKTFVSVCNVQNRTSDGIVKLAPIDCSCTSSRYSSGANIQIFSMLYSIQELMILPNRN
jgi:hypothetical protein